MSRYPHQNSPWLSAASALSFRHFSLAFLVVIVVPDAGIVIASEYIRHNKVKDTIFKTALFASMDAHRPTAKKRGNAPFRRVFCRICDATCETGCKIFARQLL
ncbi:hypothetical protein [Ruegeria arenilitoris]|uniref:hypothetical protein n=1 Tax=Ruegeria arenilitoris TaxID=1173585 RepID=UPI00147E5F61|nr:hypothetical protein [Ruegeria arenilitoris]